MSFVFSGRGGDSKLQPGDNNWLYAQHHETSASRHCSTRRILPVSMSFYSVKYFWRTSRLGWKWKPPCTIHHRTPEIKQWRFHLRFYVWFYISLFLSLLRAAVLFLLSYYVVYYCYTFLYHNTLTLYTVSQKNDNDFVHCNFNAHQPILVIFGKDVAEGVCYRMVICHPTSPN